MANRIKGITVEIDGSTTGLEKALKNVNMVNGAGNGEVIINQETGGYELPSTGGPGTRLFTILGSILILLSGTLLWRRRRWV
ncbi:MAG: LPXTG cell wall anchor domain-containing protein [Lachnospiraceae bacterium]|nr:LPXTG cell wall anchor domain-containing protein [Lachnospiraceae bacterium]